jgi:copper chaperone CopZ
MSDSVELKITGMTCQHCVAAVQKALAAVDGVTEVVEVDLDSGSATVRGSASNAALIAAVREAGYQASID